MLRPGPPGRDHARYRGHRQCTPSAYLPRSPLGRASRGLDRELSPGAV